MLSRTDLINGREFFPTIANGTDTEHDLNIGVSRVWVANTDGFELLVNVAAATIAIDGAGIDTGAVANNTWYYIWVLYDPTTRDSIYRFSASATSPTVPSGYTYIRRVRGAVLTNGSANVLQFGMVGSGFRFNTIITDVAQTSGFTTTETARTVSVPPSFIGVFRLVFICSGTSSTLSVYASSNQKAGGFVFSNGFLGLVEGVKIFVNASRQVASKLDSTSGVIECYIQTQGFEDII